MKVYLAGAWSRQAELCGYAHRLKDLGVEVTSRWLGEIPPVDGTNFNKFLRETALIDVEDVLRADALVRFSDAEEMAFPLVKSKLASGARMFEMGLAWNNGKPVIVVGGHQNVFDFLPNIIHLPDVESLYDYFDMTTADGENPFFRKLGKLEE